MGYAALHPSYAFLPHPSFNELRINVGWVPTHRLVISLFLYFKSVKHPHLPRMIVLFLPTKDGLLKDGLRCTPPILPHPTLKRSASQVKRSSSETVLKSRAP